MGSGHSSPSALADRALVLGLTGRAGALSLGWLTKVVPGLLGLTWLSVRGEWGQVLRMAAWTAGLITVSYLLWPQAWNDCVTFLRSSSGTVPEGCVACGGVKQRGIAALVLVAVGAHRGWWWSVPVGLVLGVPVVNPETLTYLTALVRLRPSSPTAASETPVTHRSSRYTSRTL